MKDLILADTKRILRKPTYRIIAGVALIISLITAIRTKTGVWNAVSFVSGQITWSALTAILLGISVFLAVYADEFSSNSMQCLIGRGISRFKLLAAKAIDCILVSLVCFFMYWAFNMVLGFILGAHLRAEEIRFFTINVLGEAFTTMGFSTLAAIVLYWTKNTAFSTLVNVLLYFVGTLGSFGLNKIPAVKFLHLEKGFLDEAMSMYGADIMLGTAGISPMIFKIIRVCVVSLILSYLLFRKKELDF